MTAADRAIEQYGERLDDEFFGDTECFECMEQFREKIGRCIDCKKRYTEMCPARFYDSDYGVEDNTTDDWYCGDYEKTSKSKKG